MSLVIRENGMEDHGKVRLYSCLCGRVVVRALHLLPHHPNVCPACMNSLDGQPFVVDDLSRYTERMMAAAFAGKPFTPETLIDGD